MLQSDKIGHFIAGAIISALLGLATGVPQIGLIAGIGAGIAKELVWDG